MLPIPATRIWDVIAPTSGESSCTGADRARLGCRAQVRRAQSGPRSPWQSHLLLACCIPFPERFDFIGWKVQIPSVPVVQVCARVFLDDDADMLIAVDILVYRGDPLYPFREEQV